MTDPSDILARAEEARQILDHPGFKAAVTRLRAEYHKAWTNSPPERTQDREVTYFRLRALEELLTDMQRAVTSEKLLRPHERLNNIRP
jgi:hypothetical protein